MIGPAPNGDGNGDTKRRGGRRTMLTAQLQKLIVNAVKNGHLIKDAALMLGLHPDTLSHWRSRNLQFDQALRQAEMFFIFRNIKLIAKAAKRNWTAAAWLLERKFPERFARREVVISPEEKPNLTPAEQINRLRGLFGVVGNAEDET